jgi:hypothetical protein
MKPRLHWFWRGAIASGTACVCLSLCMLFLERPLIGAIEAFDQFFGLARRGREAVSVPLVIVLPTVLIAFGTFALLTRFFGPEQANDGETRCRKCGYILRGITEPRCSECGEII